MTIGVQVGDRVRYHRASSLGVVWSDGLAAIVIRGDGGEKIGDAIAWVETENGDKRTGSDAQRRNV
jgi:hypothetical protein